MQSQIQRRAHAVERATSSHCSFDVSNESVPVFQIIVIDSLAKAAVSSLTWFEAEFMWTGFRFFRISAFIPVFKYILKINHSMV